MSILNCPCCGGTPRTIRDTSSDYMWDWSWCIECQKCGLGLEGRDTESAAIADWNRRGGIMNVNQALDRLKGGDSEDKEIAAVVEAEIERLKKIAEIFNTVAEERSVALREVDQLTREVRYLRHYGNKDCTYQADQAMENDELEDK